MAVTSLGLTNNKQEQERQNGQNAAMKGVSQQTQQKLQQYQSPYKPSEQVQKAQQTLQQVQTQKPQGYNSKYSAQLESILQKIQNPDSFKFEFNGNNLFNAYKDMYEQQGKQASMNAQGQAASMTGGYGNSYAESVGAQQYQQYMTQLFDKGLELRDKEYQAYLEQQQNQKDLYNLLQSAEATDYGRYRDTVADWQQQEEQAYNRALNEEQRDYQQYVDMMNYYTGLAQIENQAWASEQEREEAIRQFYAKMEQEQNLTYAQIKSQEQIAQWNNETSRYSTDKQAETSRYATDVGAETSRYNADLQAATSRYATDVGAETSRYTADLQAATSRYATDTQAETSRYATDVGAETSRYATDVGAETSRYAADQSLRGAQASASASVASAQINAQSRANELAYQRERDDKDRAQTQEDKKREQARKDCDALIALGKMPSDAQIEAAGYDKATVKQQVKENKNTRAEERSDKDRKAAQAECDRLLKAGIKPDHDKLQAAGYTEEYAQSQIDAYNKTQGNADATAQQAAATQVWDLLDHKRPVSDELLARAGITREEADAYAATVAENAQRAEQAANNEAQDDARTEIRTLLSNGIKPENIPQDLLQRANVTAEQVAGWATDLAGHTEQQQSRSQQIQAGWTMLEHGDVPSAALLQSMGISAEDAAAIAAYYKKPAATRGNPSPTVQGALSRLGQQAQAAGLNLPYIFNPASNDNSGKDGVR